MERTVAPRIRRACSGLLALGLALTGLTVMSSAAHAATEDTTYVSNADGTTTSTVNATVLESSDTSLTGGWYVCSGNLATASFINITGNTNVILADTCTWNSTKITVGVGDSLTIWSGVANTGVLRITGSAALTVLPGATLTVNGGAIGATAGAPSAAIGGSAATSNGNITIRWRANVEAVGAGGTPGYGGGAGIGSGGTNAANPVANVGTITVNTTGLVFATPGAGSGTGRGAGIGTGGGAGANGSSLVETGSVLAPSISSGGTVKMLSLFQAPITPTQLNSVAQGSTVTYIATPSPGYKLESASTTGGSLTKVGDDTYQFKPTVFDSSTFVSFSFVQTSALSLSVSPSSPQTYPGDVTLSAAFTDGGQPYGGIPVVFTVNGAPVGARPTNVGGVASYTFTAPAPGTYSFGASFAGNSSHDAASATAITGYVVLATQPDFAITPPSTSATVYGNAPFTLASTGKLSSGAVTWSVPNGNGVLRIDTNTGQATILAAGSVTVTATAPADASHASATATHTVTITPRLVTVSADDQATQFGDPVTLSWTPHPALIGGDTLVGSLKLDNGPQIGDIAIIEDVPFSNPNYDVTFVAGTLTVLLNDAQQAVVDEIEGLNLPISTLDQADAVASATLSLQGLSEEDIDALPTMVFFLLDQAQEQAAIVNHNDPKAGVIASGDELSWNVRLIVTPETQDTAPFTTFASKLVSGRSLIALYDIHFVDTLNNESWQPPLDSTVEVELSKVQLAGYSDIQVQHELVSNTLETVPSSLDGTRVQFSGSSFSRYGVSGIKPDNGLPNTGSNDVTGMLIAGLGAMLGGALVLRRRRA